MANGEISKGNYATTRRSSQVHSVHMELGRLNRQDENRSTNHYGNWRPRAQEINIRTKNATPGFNSCGIVESSHAFTGITRGDDISRGCRISYDYAIEHEVTASRRN